MMWLKRLIVCSVVLAFGIAGWLWLTMLSPWFYTPPNQMPAIEQRMHNVFVYGTLRYLPVRWLVMGASGDPQPAILEGFEREGLDLAPEDNSHVEGLLLNVTAKQLARLDRYERLGVRYERIKQTLANGTTAWVYVRLPTLSFLDTPSPAQRFALVTYANAVAGSEQISRLSLPFRIRHE